MQTLVLLCLCVVGVVLGAPAPKRNSDKLSAGKWAEINKLSPASRSKAIEEVDAMGNFDEKLMFTDEKSKGKFYVVDNMPVPAAGVGRNKRLISGTPPTGYTAEGMS